MSKMHTPLTACCNKLASQAEMALYDQNTIAGGTASPDLMEKAGKECFEKLRDNQILPESDELSILLCGPGNNGGDGLVIARHILRSQSCKVVVVVSSAKKYSPEFKLQLQSLQKVSGKVLFFPEIPDDFQSHDSHILETISENDLLELLKQSNLIIDCLLGTGQSDAPRKSIKQIIEILNRAHDVRTPTVVSLDMPSGINGDTGVTYSPHVSASYTIPVELVKRGMIQYPARTKCGSLLPISINLLTDGPCEFYLLKECIESLLPVRMKESHKGDFGKVLVIGGSFNMPGAPALSCLGALKAGAGGVTLASPNSASAQHLPPEAMLETMEACDKFTSQKHLKHVLGIARDYSVLVIGPGLGQAEETSQFVCEILRNCAEEAPYLVIDADTLNIMARKIRNGCKFNLKNAIVTPHPGEAARLLGSTASEVQRDRYGAARDLHALTGASVLLKGASSVIYGRDSDGENRGFVNVTGNPYMASPGSGDVLCGVIAALVSQGISCLEATCLGAFIHGKAGDAVFADKHRAVLASEIADRLSIFSDR